jgi:hypothetical protein
MTDSGRAAGLAHPEHVDNVRRLAHDVVQDLLDAMAITVTDYHPSVGRTAPRVNQLIQGTAFFPGGSGLWRGSELRGPLPEYFPDSPVMFVLHNYDKIASHDRAIARGGEVDSHFWRGRLLPIITRAGLDPSGCFFTNALTGCIPGNSAVGDMPTTEGYEEQCLRFLGVQIGIVRPRVVIAFGDKARARLRKVMPSAPALTHPSAREFSPLATRSERQAEQSARLAKLLN